MGRTLEVLRRRNGLGPAPANAGSESPADPVSAAAQEQQSTVTGILADDDPLRGNVPFIEVPDTTNPAAPSGPVAVGQPPQVGRQSCRFRPHATGTATRASTLPDGVMAWEEPLGHGEQGFLEAAQALVGQLAASQVRSLYFCSLLQAGRTPAVTVNLVLGLFRSGMQRVLVIEEGPGGAGVSRMLGRPATPGWSDFLVGLPADQVIQPTEWRGFHLVGPGNRLVHSTMPTGRCCSRSRIDELSQRYDLLLVAPEPIGDIEADAASPVILSHLAWCCDGLAIVLPSQVADGIAAEKLTARLAAADCNVLGTLVVPDEG